MNLRHTSQAMSSPLSGKTVVITRPIEQARPFQQQLEARGATVIVCPAIAIVPVPDPASLEQALKGISSYDWVVFTSAQGVTHTMTHLTHLGQSPEALASCRIAVVGPATEESLQHYGLTASAMPETYVAEALFDALQNAGGGVRGWRVLLLQADQARDTLRQSLEAAGAHVDAITAYCTVPASPGPELAHLIQHLQAHHVDVLTFSSASAVTGLHTGLAPTLTAEPSLLETVRLAAIGPVTAQALRETFGRADIVADTHTVPGLIHALESDYNQQQ